MNALLVLVALASPALEPGNGHQSGQVWINKDVPLPGPGGGGNGGGGAGGAGADPLGPEEPGARSWFRLPAALAPSGIPTQLVAGDWNRDGVMDAALLMDEEVFVVVGPDSMRGGVLLELPPILDLEVLPGAGPDGQDAIVTVSSAGLWSTTFDNGTASFSSISLDAALWAGARAVRAAELDGGSPTELVGIGVGGHDLLAYWPESGQATLITTLNDPAAELGRIDWNGDGVDELAVRTPVGIGIVDALGNVLSSRSSSRLPAAMQAVRRPGESAERIAWIDADVRLGQVLRVSGDGVTEESFQLPRVDVSALGAGDLDGDGGDELFLSHRASDEQILLTNTALAGDAQSRTFDPAQFTIISMLPPAGTIASSDALVYTSAPPAAGSGGAGGGGSQQAQGGAGPGTLVLGGGAGPGGTVPGGPTGVDALDTATATGFTPEDPNVWNLFLRNEARPSFADFDGDGDTDLLFPIPSNGLMVLHRGVAEDETKYRVVPGTSSLQTVGSELRLTFFFHDPVVVPAEATHLELVVWTSTILTQLGFAPQTSQRHSLSIGMPEGLEFLLPEATIPFDTLYHIVIRFIHEGPTEEIVEAWPSTTSTYTSITALYEAMKAAVNIRGGGKTTPKTGPVFVGGIAPRPHLDAFMPGIMPRAPGGGQVQ